MSTITFPAYTVEVRDPNEVSLFKAGDEVRVEIRGIWRPFKFGSVVSYSLRNGDDPVAAVDRAREHGHELVWLSAQATALTAWDQPHETFPGLHMGSIVFFEGREYRLVPAPNDNIRLERVN